MTLPVRQAKAYNNGGPGMCAFALARRQGFVSLLSALSCFRFFQTKGTTGREMEEDERVRVRLKQT
jgi:hypothetical protein